MVEAHIRALLFLAVWVVLANDRRFAEGESSLPIRVIGYNERGYDDLFNQVEEPSELKLVHVLFRHGDRTPDREEMLLYPDDPNINNTFYPYGLKALTNAGKARAYDIGVFLRRQYSELLNKIYVPEEIYVRTTDYDRTKMSVLACLAGLYPPDKIQQWNKHLLWQPIPYNTVDFYEDDMMYYYTCPRFWEARLESLYTEEFQSFLEPHRELFELVSNYTGKNLTTPEDIFYIDNLFQAEKNYGIDPPDWAIPIMDEIKEMTVIEYNLQFSTDELKRIGGGILLNKMITDSYAKIKKTLKPPGRKMFLYSGHENNVAAVLACSGVFEFHQPPYGATFILELHEMLRTKTFAFRILYLKDVSMPPEILPIPDCGQMCPFEKFVELTKNTVTTTFKKNCKKSNS